MHYKTTLHRQIADLTRWGDCKPNRYAGEKLNARGLVPLFFFVGLNKKDFRHILLE